MTNTKKHTDKDTTLHPIVKTIKARGYTNIVMTFGTGYAARGGWTIKTDQLKKSYPANTLPVISQLVKTKDWPPIVPAANPKPQWRHLTFQTDKALNEWLDKTKHQVITFEDNGQDLITVWIDKLGEIINANLQTSIWCGKFIDLRTVFIGKSVTMYFEDDKKWRTMNFKVENIHYHVPSIKTDF